MMKSSDGGSAGRPEKKWTARPKVPPPAFTGRDRPRNGARTSARTQPTRSAAPPRPQVGVLQLRLGRGKLDRELSEHLRVRVERVAGRAPGPVAERWPPVGHDPNATRSVPSYRAIGVFSTCRVGMDGDKVS